MFLLLLFQRYYPPSTAELEGIGTCELTANEGHPFCPLGVADCIDSLYGPKCRSELHTSSIIEASSRFNSPGQITPGN